MLFSKRREPAPESRSPSPATEASSSPSPKRMPTNSPETQHPPLMVDQPSSMAPPAPPPASPAPPASPTSPEPPSTPEHPLSQSSTTTTSRSPVPSTSVPAISLHFYGENKLEYTEVYRWPDGAPVPPELQCCDTSINFVTIYATQDDLCALNKLRKRYPGSPPNKSDEYVPLPGMLTPEQLDEYQRDREVCGCRVMLPYTEWFPDNLAFARLVYNAAMRNNGAGFRRMLGLASDADGSVLFKDLVEILRDDEAHLGPRYQPRVVVREKVNLRR